MPRILDHTHYSPAHSDYLIHWTGRDIDDANDNGWHLDHSSTTDSKVTGLYLDRLKSILRYGLWMMDDVENISFEGTEFSRPPHCRTCFTELKLSSVRSHARHYGRLGFGFKRFFVFNRLGAPMAYYNEHRANWFTPSLWRSQQGSYEEYYSCFLKPMSVKTSDTTMRYDFYDESEWRIIYSEEIALRLSNSDRSKTLNTIVPKEKFTAEFQQVIQNIPSGPKALIPINDPWFAMIIYPSLAVKIAAEADPEVRSLIRQIKPGTKLPKEFDKRNPAWLEKHGKPIELDLDACRNF